MLLQSNQGTDWSGIEMFSAFVSSNKSKLASSVVIVVVVVVRHPNIGVVRMRILMMIMEMYLLVVS